MQKFKVTITRIDEYEISIDETVWTPEELKNWSKSFYPTENTKELAKHVAGAIFHSGSGDGFMEGFAIVKQLRNDNTPMFQMHHGKKVLEEDYTKGLLAKIIDENEDIEFEVEEIK